MASKTINISVEETTKAKAQAIFESLGMSFSTGVNIYLEQVVLKKGIPFALKVSRDANAKKEKPQKKASISHSKERKQGTSASELSLSDIINGLKEKDCTKTK